MSTPKERPYHIEAIERLRDNYTPERFRTEIGECRAAIAQVIAEDNSSDQQIARVHILRYLDLLLSRAARWSDDQADLMAVVLRGQIDLRDWAKFVSNGPDEVARFMKEVDIDVRELHEKLEKALPGELGPLGAGITAKRKDFSRADDREEYYHKLCSKLIHPSALVILHPEQTLDSAAWKAQLATGVFFYAWDILTLFHDVEWFTLTPATRAQSPHRAAGFALARRCPTGALAGALRVSSSHIASTSKDHSHV